MENINLLAPFGRIESRLGLQTHIDRKNRRPVWFQKWLAPMMVTTSREDIANAFPSKYFHVIRLPKLDVWHANYSRDTAVKEGPAIVKLAVAAMNKSEYLVSS